MSLPFELYKGHKATKKYQWRKMGLITDNFDEIYNRYIYSSQCEKCETPYKNSRDRHMDHCHINGEFRNILCKKCNTMDRQIIDTNTGYKNIVKINENTYKLGHCFRIQISRHGKLVFNKERSTVEKAIEIRDKFILDNPEYFL